MHGHSPYPLPNPKLSCKDSICDSVRFQVADTFLPCHDNEEGIIRWNFAKKKIEARTLTQGAGLIRRRIQWITV